MQFKTKAKVLAASVAMAMSAYAQADILTPGTDSSGNGELFLMVWDDLTKESYTRDLSVQINSFLPGSFPASSASSENPVTNVTPAGGLTTVFGTPGGSSIFSDLFSNNDAANIRWTVTAGDNLVSTSPTAAAGVRRVLVTAEVGAAAPVVTNGNLASANGTMITWLGVLNSLGGCASQLECSLSGASQQGSGADPAWANLLTTGYDIVGEGYTDPMNFYALRGPNSTQAGAPAQAFLYQNNPIATWSLASDGTLTYQIAAVPEPSTYAMLGAGLLALFGVARRRMG